MIEFHINNYVYVKLTDCGRDTLRQNHDELNVFAKGTLGEYKPPKEDEAGWSKWQLWCLMAELGGKCYNGGKVPFEAGIRINAT